MLTMSSRPRALRMRSSSGELIRVFAWKSFFRWREFFRFFVLLHFRDLTALCGFRNRENRNKRVMSFFEDKFIEIAESALLGSLEPHPVQFRIDHEYDVPRVRAKLQLHTGS